MTAGNYILCIEQGADLSVDFVCSNDDGTPIDWSGFTGAAQVRKNYASPDPLADLVVTFPHADTIRVSLPAADTETIITLPAGTTQFPPSVAAVWDLELTETATGRVLRLLSGQANIMLGVTR